MNMEHRNSAEFYEPKSEKLKRAFKELKPYLATAAIALIAYNEGRLDQRIEDLTESLNRLETQMEEVETYIEDHPIDDENIPHIPGTLDQMENIDPDNEKSADELSFT
jgi:DNA repair ATPase RecN